jgi:RNA polymerase sigma factor (sigma-70 family)
MSIVALSKAGSSARPINADASLFVQRWDPEIRRAAVRHAKRYGYRADADDFAQEARIRLASLLPGQREAPDHYLRAVIGNAVLAAGPRRNAPVTLEPLGTEAEKISADIPDIDHCLIAAVAAWTRQLTPRLREIYRLLYCEGCTQTQASRVLRVSQPRIAQ